MNKLQAEADGRPQEISPIQERTESVMKEAEYMRERVSTLKRRLKLVMGSSEPSAQEKQDQAEYPSDLENGLAAIKRSIKDSTDEVEDILNRLRI